MAEENAKLVIRLETSSREFCAGAVGAFMMRRLAARAGSYAPGIQESIFYELLQCSFGFDLYKVADWIRSNRLILHDLGYNLLVRVVSEPTSDVMGWVHEGNGYRAAVLSTERTTLYGEPQLGSDSHAVGLTINDSTSGIADPSLGGGMVMVDPWPRRGQGKFLTPPPTLDAAHRDHKYTTLLMFWSGYG